MKTPEKYDVNELILFGPKITKAFNSCEWFL